MTAPTGPDRAPSRAVRLLLWPVRVAAVILIVPVQLVGETVEAAGLAAWRALDPVTAPVRRVLLAAGRAVAAGWGAAVAASRRAARALWRLAQRVPPLQWLLAAWSWLTDALIRWLDAVGRSADRLLLALTPFFQALARVLAHVFGAVEAVAGAVRRAARWVLDTFVRPPLRWLQAEVLAPAARALREASLSWRR
jgi:hypothetical protein